MRLIAPTLALAVPAFALVVRQNVANTLTISTNGSVASSPLLYGYMYEVRGLADQSINSGTDCRIGYQSLW